MNTIIFSVGTLIGTLFLGYMLVNPGNKNTGKVRYHLKSRFKTGLLAIFLLFVAGSLASIFFGTEGMTPQKGVEISFWISLIFMMIYLQADDLLITETGLAFVDLFGKVRGRYYPWRAVKDFKIAPTRVSFEIEVDSKTKRAGISCRPLDETTLKEMEKMLKKAAGTYVKEKGR